MKTKNKDRVVALLEEAINTRIERNKTYSGASGFGGAYKQHGYVIKSLFPDGLELNESHDYGRYAILDIIIGKLLRYCNNFQNGGHDDSLKDISVYAAMLRELDEEVTKCISR